MWIDRQVNQSTFIIRVSSSSRLNFTHFYFGTSSHSRPFYHLGLSGEQLLNYYNYYLDIIAIRLLFNRLLQTNVLNQDIYHSETGRPVNNISLNVI